MRYTQEDLYAAKVPISGKNSSGFNSHIFRSSHRQSVLPPSYGNYPVQRPLARLRVMLSRWVIAYYGLIRDSRSSHCLIFFNQWVFALRHRMGWFRELPQFNPRLCSIVPPSVPRRSRRLPTTVPSPSALAFATLAQARLTLRHLRRLSGGQCNGAAKFASIAAARWIARPSSARAFTFELSTPESPHGVVEYNYTGKQSIPVTGLTPARNAALWAANKGTEF